MWMNFSTITKCCWMPGLLFSLVGFAQQPANAVDISLNNLDAFKDPGINWVISGDPLVDLQKAHDMRPVSGEGVVVNNLTKNNQTHLYTKEEFGDLFLELDFMMAKNSNSGIFLQGRYELQLLDSWTRTVPTFADCGGIYARWNATRGTYEGTPPGMNVSRAPGLWQHLTIKFLAPKFNSKGEKIADARFEEVYLNGVLVQQQAAVTGPTGAPINPAFNEEKPTGPLVLQGDHGLVAFKNIRYKKSWNPDEPPKGDQYWVPGSPYWNTVDPMVVTPLVKPSFIKTFLMCGDKKLTHVLSVGDPRQINYSYDLKQGNIFQIWRGAFLDLAMSWRDRGGMQLAQPLGSVIPLSDAPVLAILPDEKAPWPDSISFDEMNNKGYTLDKQRSPTFQYSSSGLEVKDSIVVQNNGESLSRTLTVNNAPQNLYCRIAAGKDIKTEAPGLFSVNGKSYYVSIDSKYKPIIRHGSNGDEILVKYVGVQPVTYSIIW